MCRPTRPRSTKALKALRDRHDSVFQSPHGWTKEKLVEAVRRHVPPARCAAGARSCGVECDGLHDGSTWCVRHEAEVRRNRSELEPYDDDGLRSPRRPALPSEPAAPAVTEQQVRHEARGT